MRPVEVLDNFIGGACIQEEDAGLNGEDAIRLIAHKHHSMEEYLLVMNTTHHMGREEDTKRRIALPLILFVCDTYDVRIQNIKVYRPLSFNQLSCVSGKSFFWRLKLNDHRFEVSNGFNFDSWESL
ncbi:PCDHD2 [Lepeophtheirus salmonis]|uniref:PCDHD2 n=1 Tax=Lepeophtheirus salmonis TaxID=72036 RepID=A0A7R8HDX6_LEPSM|nr:PCDHD2 [Lepeophtheirus salmonis]CAF3043856.1 PCDHD2 [Lepeophtheirus salmonis]